MIVLLALLSGLGGGDAANGQQPQVNIPAQTLPKPTMLGQILPSGGWAQSPTGADIDRVFPNEARGIGKPGYVKLSCLPATAGALKACQVLEETPAGVGLAQAALALTPLYRMTTASAADARAGERVLFYIAFGLHPNDKEIAAAHSKSIATNADWVLRPDGAAFQRLFPLAARKEHLSGRSTMQCDIAASGFLSNCRIVEETPQGKGFGEATLKLSRFFMMVPAVLDGHTKDDSKVDVPVNWTLDGAAPVAPAGSHHPRWVKRPSGEAFDRNYLHQAKLSGVEGHAVMRCVVDENGKLRDCEILSEEPPGKGFGAATLRLAPEFQMTTATEDGRKTGGARVDIPVSWKLAR